jgi:hypothetical protein
MTTAARRGAAERRPAATADDVEAIDERAAICVRVDFGKQGRESELLFCWWKWTELREREGGSGPARWELTVEAILKGKREERKEGRKRKERRERRERKERK